MFRQGWVDLTPPVVPVLLSPIGGDLISGAVFLRWEHADNLDWAAITDSVWVYQEVDSFLKLRVRRLVMEQETLVEGLTPGNYAWFVKSVDQAGNVSGERGEEFVVE